MPKLHVYVPDELAARLKERRDEVNVSSVLQDALAAKLDELGRQDRLREVLAEFEHEQGPLTQAELDAARVALGLPDRVEDELARQAGVS